MEFLFLLVSVAFRFSVRSICCAELPFYIYIYNKKDGVDCVFFGIFLGPKIM